MFFKKIVITIFAILLIGCSDNNSNESSKDIDKKVVTSNVVETSSNIPTPTPTADSSKSSTIDIERVENPSVEVVEDSVNEVEPTTKPPKGEPSQIDNILSNSPRVENPSVNRSPISSGGVSESGSDFGYVKKFINNSNCSQIIDKEFLVICYDYKMKEAKSVAYKLDGDLVNELNIKDRPSFYEEEAIDERYRAEDRDYVHSGYDRGHLAPDASFDWSKESLEATYSLANIIPQAPTVNRKMWVKVEQYARDKAVELGEIEVINVVKFSDEPEYIGKNRIAISMGYYKILINEQENYKECFYYSNDLNSSSKNDTVASHRVNCGEI
jgi:endonuclease G